MRLGGWFKSRWIFSIWYLSCFRCSDLWLSFRSHTSTSLLCLNFMLFKTPTLVKVVLFYWFSHSCCAQLSKHLWPKMLLLLFSQSSSTSCYLKPFVLFVFFLWHEFYWNLIGDKKGEWENREELEIVTGRSIQYRKKRGINNTEDVWKSHQESYNFILIKSYIYVSLYLCI